MAGGALRGVDPQRVVCRFDVSTVFDDDLDDEDTAGGTRRRLTADSDGDIEDELDTDLDEDDLEPMDADR